MRRRSLVGKSDPSMSEGSGALISIYRKAIHPYEKALDKIRARRVAKALARAIRR